MKGDELLVILLGVLFIGLKISGIITWSWWWVLSPFWLPIPIFIVLFFLGFLVVVAKNLMR